MPMFPMKISDIFLVFRQVKPMKTEYELSKHRFYELKHFCLQYPEWEHLYSQLDGWAKEIGKNEGDTTSRDGIRRADLAYKMTLVREVCHDICAAYEQEMFDYVILGLKPKLSSDQMDFWHYYRKFFWELSRRRG